MDTMKAMAIGQAAAMRGARLRVFDWDKAAKLIRKSGAKSAEAGLSGDWEYTGGPIFEGGKPVPKNKTYTYLASIWATPELTIDGGEPIPCVRDADGTDWDAHTYWPPSALALLDGSASATCRCECDGCCAGGSRCCTGPRCELYSSMGG